MPIDLFISYSHKDEEYRIQLENHLKPLKRMGIINDWSDRKIDPGDKWRDAIDRNLEAAQIILLLISSDFLASDYCYDIEMKRALEKHEAGESRVIPIILRPVLWKETPFAGLNPLPRDARPVVGGSWENIDEAWVHVVQNIESICQDIPSLKKRSSARIRDFYSVQLVPTPVPNPVGRSREIEKVIDSLKKYTSVAIAGIPGVGKTTVLAAAVRELANIKDRLYDYIAFHRISEKGSKEERLNLLLLSLISCLDPSASIESENPAVRFGYIRKMMAGCRVLLVIDNADDAESLELVQAVYESLSNLTIVVTSRHLSWKNFYMVRVRGLSGSDGAALFRELYDGVKYDEEKLASLCLLVEGHPMMITHLALEARESGMDPKELRARLPKFNIHRDLARRFDSVLSRLPGACSGVPDVVGLLNTATLRVDLVREVLPVSMGHLENLADQLLIHLHPDNRHFTVHKIIRTWCRSRLESKSLRTLFPKMIAFYLRFLNKRRGLEPGQLTEIDEEWPNILGLVDRLPDFTDKEDVELVFRLVDEAIGDHFDDPNGYVPRRKQMSGFLDEPLNKNLLKNCHKVNGLLAARIEKNLGHFFYWRGNYEQAESLFYRARDRYRGCKDIEGEAATTWLLGYLADDWNRYREAQTLYEQGSRLAEQVEITGRELVAVGCHLVGCSLYHQGRYKEAETQFLRALGLLDDTADPHLKARIKRRLAGVALRLGRLNEAEEMLNSVKCLVDRLQRPRDAARISRHLGFLYLQQDKLQKSERALNQALTGFEELNARRGIGYTNYCLAILRRKQGRLAEARELCEESLKIAKETESLYGEAAAYEEFANILECEGGQERECDRFRHHACNIYSVIEHCRAQDLKEQLRRSGAMKKTLPENIKGVLFDLMDTLAYLKPGIYETTLQGFADSIGVSLSRFKWAWGESRKDAQIGYFKTTAARVHWVINKLEVSISPDVCNEMADKVESMWRDNVTLYEDTEQLLKHLHRDGFFMAVVSNGPVAMECLKESLGINAYLKAFILSSEVGVPKPDKHIYYRSLGELGLSASQCVFIGDGNDRELDGAREVGLCTVKIERARPSYANLKNESLDWDVEVGNLAELHSLFRLDR